MIKSECRSDEKKKEEKQESEKRIPNQASPLFLIQKSETQHEKRGRFCQLKLPSFFVERNKEKKKRIALVE